MAEKEPYKRRRNRRHEGYQHKSPAVCVVVYDMHGKPMPDTVAAKILNAVTDIAFENNYLISFTRT